MALRTAEAASTFWERLVAYVDDEYLLLMSFHLLVKHVLLLLSNQVVQICDCIFEFRGNAANVDITERAAAAARFAWVTLQAQDCMIAYLKDKFRHHRVLNSTHRASHGAPTPGPAVPYCTGGRPASRRRIV